MYLTRVLELQVIICETDIFENIMQLIEYWRSIIVNKCQLFVAM